MLGDILILLCIPAAFGALALFDLRFGKPRDEEAEKRRWAALSDEERREEIAKNTF